MVKYYFLHLHNVGNLHNFLNGFFLVLGFSLIFLGLMIITHTDIFFLGWGERRAHNYHACEGKKKGNKE